MSLYSKYLEYLVRKGAVERYGHDMTQDEFYLPAALAEGPEFELHRRINHELDIINEAGYPSYFLIVEKLMRYCNANGIPVGPGRGSVCGSVVAYCLYITDIDPIKWAIPFERFLHLDRIQMPDIDIDICQARRGEAIDYLREQYGEGNTAQIITFGTMQARGAIKDMLRILHVKEVLKQDYSQELANLIPEGSGADQTILSDFIKTEEGESFWALMQRVDGDFCEGAGHPRRFLWEQILEAEGNRKHGSIHAAGVVIHRDNLANAGLPVYRRNRTAELQVCYDMEDSERMGLLKLDVLGLRTVTVLGDAETLIRKLNPEFRIKDVPLDDAATYRLLCDGNTVSYTHLTLPTILRV